MAKPKGKIIIFLLMLLFCSCKTQMQSNTSKILHHFNWLAESGSDEAEWKEKPFLQKNADGSNGAAGVFDINRDGKPEFLMAAYHVPRGIPAVEVFTLTDTELLSIGGFFESHNFPRKLSYYKDRNGRMLFLQETQSDYGGITTILVATYADDLTSFPVSGYRKYHVESDDFSCYYYVFPDNMTEECTIRSLYAAFSDSAIDYSATKEEYHARISGFMSTLTWVEDVQYDYPVYYHLYNGAELPVEIRGKEISEGLATSPPKDFGTPEEIKKTSARVADVLYQSYINDCS